MTAQPYEDFNPESQRANVLAANLPCPKKLSAAKTVSNVHDRPLAARLKTTLRHGWYGPKRKPGRNNALRSRYLGADMIVNLDDEIGYEIALNRFKWRELNLMLDACKRFSPEVFVDIGANLGVYSCVLGRHKAVPRIVAFEPERANFARLAANVKLNRLDGVVELHEVALGAKSGSIALSPASPSNRGTSRIAGAADENAYDVPVIPFDDVLRIDGRRIAAKIDVEGSELEVLMGGAQFFTRNAGYAQISGHGNQVAGVIAELMAAFGWHVVERVGHDLRFEKA